MILCNFVRFLVVNIFTYTDIHTCSNSEFKAIRTICKQWKIFLWQFKANLGDKKHFRKKYLQYHLVLQNIDWGGRKQVSLVIGHANFGGKNKFNVKRSDFYALLNATLNKGFFRRYCNANARTVYTRG